MTWRSIHGAVDKALPHRKEKARSEHVVPYEVGPEFLNRARPHLVDKAIDLLLEAQLLDGSEAADARRMPRPVADVAPDLGLDGLTILLCQVAIDNRVAGLMPQQRVHYYVVAIDARQGHYVPLRPSQCCSGVDKRIEAEVSEGR